jgi:putative phosphoribosyl transferase
MRAAVAVVAANAPSRTVVAAPTMAAATARAFAALADDVVTVMTPKHFESVGQWYEDFRQVTDEDVRRLLRERDGSGPEMSRSSSGASGARLEVQVPHLRRRRKAWWRNQR